MINSPYHSGTSTTATTTTFAIGNSNNEEHVRRVVPFPNCLLLKTNLSTSVDIQTEASKQGSDEQIRPHQQLFTNYDSIQHSNPSSDCTPSSSTSLAPILQTTVFPKTTTGLTFDANSHVSNGYPTTVSTQVNFPTFESHPVSPQILKKLKYTTNFFLRWWHFGSNTISTTRYNILTFIPLNLFEQFLRISNIFFLLIVILQFIPGLSPLGNLSTIFPFVFVILISACRAAWDDLKRWISDLKVNARKIQIWNFKTNQFITKAWRQVKVGDVVLLNENQVLPADVLLLTCQSSISKNQFVFVETADLDGETNLKVKKCVWRENNTEEDWNSHVNHLLHNSLNGFVECEYPSPNLQSFDGQVYYLNTSKQICQQISISQDHMLWRGTILRNTEKAVGLVLYTGHQTKILKNRHRTPHKISRVEKFINRYIFAWILFIFALSLVCTLGDVIYDFTLFKTSWYLPQVSHSWITYVRDFFSFLILYNTLLPIILYASMDLGLFFQSVLMQKDRKMDHCQVKSSNLNGELGQVSYLFSDKTGTLTKNRMHLVHLCINGVMYGTTSKEHQMEEEQEQEQEEQAIVYESKFEDTKLVNGNWRQEEDPMVEHCIRILCLANSVTPIEDGHHHIQYYYTSSDEYAFVLASKKMGMTLLSNTLDTITLEYNDTQQQHTFTLLAVVPFTSERARFTCIVKEQWTGKLFLYCKGSDQILLPKLQPHFPHQHREALQRFAMQGYRTMIFAMKEITEEQVMQIPQQQWMMEQWIEQMEMNMQWIGVSAMEDVLQNRVKESIGKCREAGMKVWMVSGDKKETAVSVAHSIALLPSSYQSLLVLPEDTSLLKQQLIDYCSSSSSSSKELHDKCMLITGKQFAHLSSDPQGSKLFFYLAAQCASGIGCRMTPMQKSLLVRGMKHQTGAICLAIGDGSNDISMLHVANVGVGLISQEGMQASRAADYSIKQFVDLQRLILVHGRWNYQRIALMMLYNCYKSIVLYGAQVLYAFYSGFSQSSIHERWMLSIYTQFLTLLPIVVNGVLDQDVEDSIALGKVKPYKQGPQNKHFNKMIFVAWMIDSILHCVVCFFFPLYILENSYQFTNGRAFDTNATGVTIYACVMSVIQVKLILESKSITILHVLAHVVSVAAWFIAVLFLSHFWLLRPTDAYPFREFYKSVEMHLILGEPLFYLTVLLTTVVAVLVDILWKAVVRGEFIKGPLFSCLYCKRIEQ